MLLSMAPIVTDRVGSRMHYLSTLAGTPVGKQDRSPRPCPVRGPLSLTLSIAKCYIRPTFLPLITHSDFYAVEARQFLALCGGSYRPMGCRFFFGTLDLAEV